MELGEWTGGWIIENSDNRGSDNRGSTVCILFFSHQYAHSPLSFNMSVNNDK